MSSKFKNRDVGSGGGGGGVGAPNNSETVVHFLFNTVLNEKEYKGQSPPPI